MKINWNGEKDWLMIAGWTVMFTSGLALGLHLGGIDWWPLGIWVVGGITGVIMMGLSYRSYCKKLEMELED